MAPKNDDSPSQDDERARELRELALVDRVIGLEAEVARLSVTSPPGRMQLLSQQAEILRLQGEIAALYRSRTWRLGSTLVHPLKAMRNLRRKRSEGAT